MPRDANPPALSDRNEVLQAYSVRVCFDLKGAPFYLGDEFRRFEDGDDCGEEHVAARLKCEPEVVAVLKPFCDALQRLGCISAGLANDGNAPLFFLVTAGDWEPPRGPLPYDPQGPAEILLGNKVDHTLSSYPGARLCVCAWVEPVDLAGTHARLQQLAPGHELSCWGGERTPDRLPKESENPEEWAIRNSVSAAYMDTLSDRLRLLNFDLLAFSLPPPSVRGTPNFVVDGWLPLGDVASLVAPGGVGKSSFAHQLLAVASAPAIAGQRKSFLGRDVPGQFFAALLSGEEGEWYFKNRQDRFEGLWPRNFIMRPTLTRAQFTYWLAEIESLAAQLPGGTRGILEVDSVQAFIGEDDTKAHVASEFYQRLKDWAQSTGWAVLVIHHTTKTPARSFTQFRASVRGSSVHVDMPRNVIGMIDRGADLVEVGIVKSNLPPELAWLREGQSVLCEKRRETHTFELVSSVDACGSAASGDDIERVVAAIGELNAAARNVQKSGKDGLYELRLSSLIGLSRSFIHRAIDALISADRVDVTKSGLVLVQGVSDCATSAISPR